MKHKKLALALLLAISPCSFASETMGVQSSGMDLDELQGMHYYEGMSLSGENDITNKRMKSMRDAAMAVGAQHGYVATMNELRKRIDEESESWDSLFPFSYVMKIATPGEKSLYYLPPVIIELKGLTASSDDNRVIKVSNTYYEVFREERLVTNPPDWREYLLIDSPVDVSKPVGALLPKTPEEQNHWSDGVAEGWQAGIYQANEEMASRVRNLGTDFNGMLLYLQLVNTGENVMTPSYVAEEKQSTVKGTNNMHIGMKTFAITAKAEFNDNVRSWIPMDLDPREGFRSSAEKERINRGE